jgi:hypothetical protein
LQGYFSTSVNFVEQNFIVVVVVVVVVVDDDDDDFIVVVRNKSYLSL